MRIMLSTAPPGGYGTTILIVLVVCEKALLLIMTSDEARQLVDILVPLIKAFLAKPKA